LRHDQLQTEAVFSLHAGLQAEFLWKHGIANPGPELNTKDDKIDEHKKMEGDFINDYFTARPLKIVFNTVGKGEILCEMSVKEYKGEAVQREKKAEEEGKIQEEDDEDRQNPHKIRFDAHMDIVNKADKKKYAGKQLRFSVYEQVPIPKDNPGIGKGKNALKHVTNPVHQCPDVSTYDEEASVFKFPTTKLLSN